MCEEGIYTDVLKGQQPVKGQREGENNKNKKPLTKTIVVDDYSTYSTIDAT